HIIENHDQRQFLRLPELLNGLAVQICVFLNFQSSGPSFNLAILHLIFELTVKTTTDTPLMQQHRAIKQKYPDAVLLFRVGDFYETFDEDAVISSRVLGITLTKRNNGAATSSELA